MKASRIPLIVLSLAAAPVYASDVDLSLTNDSVKGQVNFFGTNSDIQVGTGYTYHEGSRHIGNVDFHAQGPHRHWQPAHHSGHWCSRLRMG